MKVNKKSAPSSQTVQKNNFKKCSLKIKETLQNYNIFFCEITDIAKLQYFFYKEKHEVSYFHKHRTF